MTTINNRFTERHMTKNELNAALLFEAALKGDIKAQHKFLEGISTSDIPVQMTPVLNRLALDNYAEVPVTWTEYAARQTLASFESTPYMQFAPWDDQDVEASTEGRTFIDGGLPRVPEYGEYSVLRFSASQKSLKLAKSGVQIKFSWESLIKTRDFGLIQRAFREFGARSRRQEDYEAALQLVTQSGLNTANWNSTNQNIVTNNPQLSLPALDAAFTQLATQTYNGNRVTLPGNYKLVIPRSLLSVAEAIKNIQTIETDVVSGGTTTKTISSNTTGSKFDIVVADSISTIAGAAADKFWFLIPPPGSTPNPSVLNLFLQGHETPEIFVKKSTDSSPEDGAYEDDSYSTKVRHANSGAFLEPAATIMSKGTDAA